MWSPNTKRPVRTFKRISRDDLPLAPTTQPAISPDQPHERGITLRSSDSKPNAVSVQCPMCRDSGWLVMDAPYGHPNFGKLRRCVCLEREHNVAMARELEERAASAKASLNDELGALRHCTFAAFDLARPLEIADYDGKRLGEQVQRRQIEQALEAARAYAQQPCDWLYLHGLCGAGKSHLAAAIAHEAQAAGWDVIYRSVPGLLDNLRAGYKRGTYDELIERVIGCGLLILDDIGAEHGSSNAEAILFRILNERQGRPTVLTSNVHPNDLSARLSSRISGKGRTLWMPISDYRRLVGRRREG